LKANHRKKIAVTTAPERKLEDEIERLRERLANVVDDNAKKAARASKLTTELEHARKTIAKLDDALRQVLKDAPRGNPISSEASCKIRDALGLPDTAGRAVFS
jgi:predicted  nucleic acid-binding Zn-ribbon protein